jgi:hypothetical protein
MMINATISEKRGELTANIRLHEPENDLFATEKGVIEHSVLVNVAFAWDGFIRDGGQDRRRTGPAAR